MNDMATHRSAGRQQHHRERSAAVSLGSLPTTLSIDYWVIDETGRLADPNRVAGLPGAARTDSPYSLAVETPTCESCIELRRSLTDRLSATVTAAHDRGCRLLALGIRPDLLVEDSPFPAGEPPPAATAGTRVAFEPEAAASTDCYNTLLALDPAFACVNTTGRTDGSQRYACGRPSLSHGGPTGRYRTDGDHDTAAHASTDRQPVAWLDGGSRIEWRSLDATTPTLLVDLIADITTVLQEATKRRLSIESFGTGFDAERLVVPTPEWRAIYTEKAIHQGLSSLLVRAYLERFGIETDWYLTASPPAVGGPAASELPALCRRRAAALEADLGVSQPS